MRGIIRGLIWSAVIIGVLVLVVGVDEVRFRLFPPDGVADVVRAAKETGISPALALAVVQEESSFDPAARSSGGAVGMMQLLPTTAAEVAERYHLDGPFDLTRPATNLRLGCLYLKELLARFDGDEAAAAAAYNAGPAQVGDWRGEGLLRPEDIPYSDTRAYVEAVLKQREMFARLLSEGVLP